MVIGGGDTGADCVGNSLREGAASVTQLELLPHPPEHRPDDRTPWPLWPQKYRLSYAIEEGRAAGRAEQDYSIVTTEFVGEDGRVTGLRYTHRRRTRRRSVPWRARRASCRPTSCCWPWASCIPSRRCSTSSAWPRTPAATPAAPVYETSETPACSPQVTRRRGQSLIVWAINEGRQAARMADRYLQSLEHTCCATRCSRATSTTRTPVPKGRPATPSARSASSARGRAAGRLGPGRR